MVLLGAPGCIFDTADALTSAIGRGANVNVLIDDLSPPQKRAQTPAAWPNMAHSTLTRGIRFQVVDPFIKGSGALDLKR